MKKSKRYFWHNTANVISVIIACIIAIVCIAAIIIFRIYNREEKGSETSIEIVYGEFDIWDCTNEYVDYYLI